MTKKYERICGLCDKKFIANSWNAKFCKNEECHKFSKADTEHRERILRNRITGGYKKKCETCQKEFIPRNMNQRYCTEDCRTEAGRLRRKNGNGNHKLNPKEKIINKVNGITQLNGINSEYKLITKWKNLAEDVLRIMNPNKLIKYSKQTQDFCLGIRHELIKKLKEQIERKGVITIEMEDQ